MARHPDEFPHPSHLVAHHGLTVHGRSLNRCAAMGITCVIQYAAADAFGYTAPVAKWEGLKG